jgi:hypothetical protein
LALLAKAAFAGEWRMEAVQIIAGFTDIKIQLAQSCRVAKDLNDLYLWFSIEENILYAHDYDQHQSCIALAVLNSDNKSVEAYFSIRRRAQKLIEYCTEHFDEKEKNLADALNSEFKLSGSFRP